MEFQIKIEQIHPSWLNRAEEFNSSDSYLEGVTEFLNAAIKVFKNKAEKPTSTNDIEAYVKNLERASIFSEVVEILKEIKYEHN